MFADVCLRLRVAVVRRGCALRSCLCGCALRSSAVVVRCGCVLWICLCGCAFVFVVAFAVMFLRLCLRLHAVGAPLWLRVAIACCGYVLVVACL